MISQSHNTMWLKQPVFLQTPGAAWAVLIIPKNKWDVRTNLHIQQNNTQDKWREGVFFLKSLTRRGEQNKLPSQTHAMEDFLLH